MLLTIAWINKAQGKLERQSRLVVRNYIQSIQNLKQNHQHQAQGLECPVPKSEPWTAQYEHQPKTCFLLTLDCKHCNPDQWLTHTLLDQFQFKRLWLYSCGPKLSWGRGSYHLSSPTFQGSVVLSDDVPSSLGLKDTLGNPSPGASSGLSLSEEKMFSFFSFLKLFIHKKVYSSNLGTSQEIYSKWEPEIVLAKKLKFT